MLEDSETRIGAGFEAMAAAEWSAARDAFTSVLEESEVPEALMGLASASYWLGDLTEIAGNPTLGAEGDGRYSDRHRKATSGSTELGGRRRSYCLPEQIELVHLIGHGPNEDPLDTGAREGREFLCEQLGRADWQPFS